MTERITVVAIEDDDDDGWDRYDLRIKFANDCALVLSLPKTADGYRPDVNVCCGGATGNFADYSVEDFRQWVEVAFGRRDHLRWLDCAGCGADSRGPMLPDHIWNQLADKNERILCLDCMEKRARERLGRPLNSLR